MRKRAANTRLAGLQKAQALLVGPPSYATLRLPQAFEQCQLPDCPLLEGQHVAVVGGGLTAAQLALLALRHGSSCVHLVMRAHNKVGGARSGQPCCLAAGSEPDSRRVLEQRMGTEPAHTPAWRLDPQVKQFDVDVHWMGRNRAAELKRFSQLRSPEQRLQVTTTSCWRHTTKPPC